MALIWWGGEDTSFGNGSPVSVSTSGSSFRSGYARSAVCMNLAFPSTARSATFTSITSGWLRTVFTQPTNFADAHAFMVGLGSSSNGAAIGVGWDTSGRPLFSTFNGSTATTLATSTGVILSSNSLYVIDFQLLSYGTGATLNLYLNGAQILTFTGDVTIPGTSSFDSVFFTGSSSGSNQSPFFSEFIVASDSTLSRLGIVTNAGNGNGTTQDWSNPAYTNWNPTTINDLNSTFSNTTGQDEQATIIQPPAGTFAIEAVKVEARALSTAGATATQLETGFNNGTTVGVGTAHTLTTGFKNYEDFFLTDPTTGVAWNGLTGYQLDLRSA